jgi:hypothetical protein
MLIRTCYATIPVLRIFGRAWDCLLTATRGSTCNWLCRGLVRMVHSLCHIMLPADLAMCCCCEPLADPSVALHQDASRQDAHSHAAVLAASPLARMQEEKEQIVEGYKKQLGLRHCKHFDRGRGKCPFGISCFYRHEYLDGRLQDRSQLPDDVRFVTDRDGQFTVVRDNTLASIFDSERASRMLRQGAAYGR